MKAPKRGAGWYVISNDFTLRHFSRMSMWIPWNGGSIAPSFSRITSAATANERPTIVQAIRTTADLNLAIAHPGGL
jgi:hypothetical protein